MNSENFSTFITILMGILVIFITSTLVSIFKMHSSMPFENFVGGIEGPVDIATEDSITAYGTFDRSVRCNLENFNVFLTHTKTNENIILTPKNLKAAPLAGTVGEGIDINMELFIPKLELGYWAAVFQGEYECTHGLVSEKKIQRLLAPNFLVVDSSK